MTVLGKILVFVNLVFSVLVGGLVVVVFTARTNYAAALDQSEKMRQLEYSLAQAKLNEVKQIKAEFAVREGDLKGTIAKLQKDLQTQVDVNKSLNDKVQTEVVQAQTYETGKNSSQNEIVRRQADVTEMKKRLDDQVTKNTELVKDNVRLTQDALTAQIESKAALERAQNLEEQYKHLATMYAKGQGTGGAIPPRSFMGPGGQVNPPPEKIEGQVVKLNGTLLQLSAGSDVGLREGHTLELYRLSPKALYLGRVRITDVGPKVAVATPVGRLHSEPQIGDQFASQIK